MTHGQFTARIIVVCLATGFLILALAVGIPAWLALSGASGWVGASLLGVVIGSALNPSWDYDPDRERDLMSYFDNLEDQWQRQQDKQDRFEDYGENTMPEGNTA